MQSLISARNIYLRVNDVSGGRREVLKDISLNINSGDFILFSGPSGAGKTKLLEILSGQTAPSSGELFIRGTDAVKDKGAAKKESGLIEEFPRFLRGMDLYENIEYVLSLMNAS